MNGSWQRDALVEIFIMPLPSINIVWALMPLDMVGYTFRQRGRLEVLVADLSFWLNQFFLFIAGNY